mgnify:CR=1 FL=1
MKKALTTIAILGGIAAAVAYKLKKDEEKKIMKLEQELLEEENSLEKHDVEVEAETACESEACSCEEGCACEESCTCEASNEENEATETQATCQCEAESCECEQQEAVDPQFPHLSAEDKKRIDEINQQVILALEENGDVHENERPVQHTVSFTSLEDLENYKTAVINKGFVVTKGEEALELYVLHIAPIDRIQLIQNIYYLANLALEMHGVYRGWKSRVSY